ncbi:hypothetical protein HRbin37_01300 [bacterium HR37]|jgi:hypothetical protein|nr:hypothetical protein HRbin37_01300 [bacterium HR37]
MRIERMDLASIKTFFSKLIRMSFFDLGREWDNQVVSYLANMLTDFVRTERLYRFTDAEGRRIQTVVEMLIESQNGPYENSEWERELRKYIGDFTLFMTGIFRDYIARGSYLRYYINEGTKSYFFVSRYDLETGKGDPVTFIKLSQDFEFYSGALDYMRKVYFQPGKSGDPFSSFVARLSKVQH